MKKIYILALASLFCFTGNVKAEEGTTNATVKMTYVDGTNCVLQNETENTDRTNEKFGEIKEGDTAIAGFNKISGDAVGFGTPAWGVNYITYLQVDASKIEGNITSATLSFEGSGSTDSRRGTTYGVGFNNSEWAADMTYNTADKSITLLGQTKSGSSKSAATFDSFTFDITDAVKNAKEGLVTILIYETIAGGGYVKNPKVEVNWTTETTYKITFKETNGIEATVTVDGKDVTKGADFADGTYTFTATATGYQDYTGEFTVAGADKEVEFTMEPKATWNYTVKNNVNDNTTPATCLEGTSVTVPYSRYIIAADGTVWMKDASNKEYNYTFTPDADNYVATIEYSETEMTDGIYFKEGEEIEGMTVVTRDNANVRCSNAAGGYSADPVNVCTLNAGTYKVEMGVFGNAGATFTLKAGETTVLTAESKGYWWDAVTEEAFTLAEATTLVFEGSASNKPLDYILITGTGSIVEGGTSAVDGVEAVKADGKWFSIQGIQVAEPTTPGLYIHNGKKVIVK